MNPIIKISELSFTYPGASAASLSNISLEVAKGEFLAVIGGNGSGKSTLCKVLNGLIPHFIAGDYSGSVLVEGMDTSELSIAELSRKIAYVYQDFENQIVCPTVLEDASFACLNYALPDYEEKGREALRLTDLSHKENDYIWQLSGGQKHLLAISGAVSLSPDILIVDEPAAQLDPAHAKKIYDVLEDLNQNHGKTIIVIEHHTEYVARYCEHALLIQNGKILWKLPTCEALQRVEELKENNIFPPQITAAAKFLRDKGVIAPKKLPTRLVDGLSAFSNLKADPSMLPDEKESEPSSSAARFLSVSAHYRAVKGADSPVLHDFSLDIRRGDKIALIGGNGAGKSTIMKLMTGLIKPAAGEIFLNGKTVKNSSPEELAQAVSFVYQNPEEMFIMDCIRSDIEYAMKVRCVPGYKQRCDELLDMFRLKELAERDGRLLSGGQMRRASLAVGIALNPSILLLDEPTANLDIATGKEIVEALNSLSDKVETVVIATHDMQLVCEWAERIIVLSAGKILADGNKAEVFKNPDLITLSGIRPPEIYEMGKLLSLSADCYTVEDFIDCFGKGGNGYGIQAV